MEKHVRYAVVGVGWIAQQAFLPSVPHTGNSVVTALVTGDAEKARVLGPKYGIARSFGYDEYHALIRSGIADAVYIATPNTLHRDFAERALKAGLHVLCEKPMAPSEADCRAMIEAAEAGGAKLMIAYRLHFEPATLAALELARSGRLGRLVLFESVATQHVGGANHRVDPRYWAGPVADMGPYPINMARQVFRAEPVEAVAFGSDLRDGLARTVAVLLRFPGDRLAQFTVSYCAEGVSSWRIVGDAGHLAAEDAYTFHSAPRLLLSAGGSPQELPFAPTDQFGGEIRYFSDCILNDRPVEPDGEEGLADVRVVLAVQAALRTGRPQRIRSSRRSRWAERGQAVLLPPIGAGPLVNAAPPQRG